MPGGRIPIGTANLDFVDNLQAATEGKLRPESFVPPAPPTTPTFVRMVVLDVIFDPNGDAKDQKKRQMWSIDTPDRRAVSNPEYTNSLPRNTIVAQRVGSDLPPMFVFPFFPSHLAMPCKPGECVWAMIEKPDAEQVKMAFWFCRITEPHPSDDVNHSHHGNAFEPSASQGSKDKFNNDKSGKSESGEDAVSELRNGIVVTSKGERKTSPENLLIKGAPEDIFERLIKDSDASKLMSYEPIPRFRKRPADLALEGSNNALIVLGTDRGGPAGEYGPPQTDQDKITRTRIARYPESDFKESAGSIDIVAGRGQVEEKLGKLMKTTSIKGAKELKKEINKSESVISAKEGDLDYKNDRSRALISQRTRVDSKFDLSSHNSSVGIGVADSADGDAAVVIKSDKVRIIARSDLQLIVTNYSDSRSPTSAPIKIDEENTSKWASITIKRSGDIIFSPSDEGYIKLGDDTADRAILCTDLPAVKASVPGVSSAVSPATAALTTTMGGAFGGTGIASQGTWAKKVLVTGAK